MCVQLVAFADQGHPVDHQRHHLMHQRVTESPQVHVHELASPISMLRTAAHWLKVEFSGKAIQTYDVDADASSKGSGGSSLSSLLYFVIYAVIVCLFAHWYRNMDGKSHFLPDASAQALVNKIGQPGQDTFEYPLFQCFNEPSLCLLSCCCAPVRWADTMDMAGLMSFVAGVAAFLVLYGLDFVSLPGSFILACLCAFKRQKLRERFSITSCTCGTILEDFCTYLWCGPCAIVQEARQIEADIVGKAVATSANAASSMTKGLAQACACGAQQ